MNNSLHIKYIAFILILIGVGLFAYIRLNKRTSPKNIPTTQETYLSVNKDTVRTVYVQYPTKVTDSITKEAKISNPEVITTYQTKYIKDTIYVPIKDTILNDSIRYYAYRSPTISFDASSYPTYLKVNNLEIKDSLSVIQYKEKGYLKTAVKNTNKNIIIQNISSSSYKLDKPSRFSVGIQVGAGVSSQGFSPYIGVGVNYRILGY